MDAHDMPVIAWHHSLTGTELTGMAVTISQAMGMRANVFSK